MFPSRCLAASHTMRTLAVSLFFFASLLIATEPRAAESDADAASGDSTDQSLATVVVAARRLNAARSEIETQTGASTYTIDSTAIAARP
jgi:hypothetical protein